MKQKHIGQGKTSTKIIQKKSGQIKPKQESQKLNSGYSQKCFKCRRDFEQIQVKSYPHLICQKIFCLPCLYVMYKTQKQVLEKSQKQPTNQHKLVMECCQKQDKPLQFYEYMFKENFCIFCGISFKQKECMVIIENHFRFCLQCYKKETDFQGQSCQSITLIMTQLIDTVPNQCIFCEKQIDFTKCQNDQMIRAFNRRLCLKCFNGSIKRNYSSNIQLLKSYQIVSLTQFGCNKEDFDRFQCSEPSCKKKIVVDFQKKNNQVYISNVQFDLVRFRGKVYCGVCLYFKYEQKRKLFLQKISRSLLSKNQINQFEIDKEIYQKHFQQKCMICSTSVTKYNPHRLLVNQKNQFFKKDQQQNRLVCQYCRKCLKKLCQKKIKDPNLSNIQEEMFMRDMELQATIRTIQNRNQALISPKIKSQQYKQFWTKHYQKQEEQKNQVNKQILSFSSQKSNKKIDLNQKLQKNQNDNQDQMDKQDNEDKTVFKEFNEKSSKVQNRDQELKGFQKFSLWQYPCKQKNLMQQIDDQVDNQTYIQNLQVISNKSKNKNIQSDLQLINQQINDIKIPEPQLFLEVCLNFFQQQDQMNESRQENHKQNLCMHENTFKILNKQNCVNNLVRIKQYITSQEIVNMISNVPDEKVWNVFTHKDQRVNNEVQQIGQNANKLRDRKVNIKCNEQTENQCKVSSCVYKKNKNTIQSQIFFKKNLKSQKMLSKEEQSKAKNKVLLNLGMMCDNCFIRYLIGMIDLETEVDKTIYQQQKQSAREMTKLLEQNMKQQMIKNQKYKCEMNKEKIDRNQKYE